MDFGINGFFNKIQARRENLRNIAASMNDNSVENQQEQSQENTTVFDRIKARRENLRNAVASMNGKFVENQQEQSQENSIFVNRKRMLIEDFLKKYENQQINMISASESFNDVFKEFQQNVPDSTSTISEKELAISYINRLLECSDITPELKNYWTEKKEVIESEIQRIKNEQVQGSNQNYNNIQDELNAYVDNYRANYPDKFTSSEARVELNLAYNMTCISYYEKMMNCADATVEQKEYCQTQINYHRRDMNYHLVDLNRANKEQNKNTESFNDVFKEFQQNVSDSTSTISEKELAISYINRFLECNDITPELKNYWAEKKEVIESEMQAIKNER